MRAVLVAATAVVLGGCAMLVPGPKLPDLPAGAEIVAGDGSWETMYDLSVERWWGRFGDYSLSGKGQYWLTEPMETAAVFAAYDEALGDWTVRDEPDGRGRWVGRSYEKWGRLVTVAVFPASEFNTPYDALILAEGIR